jgi:DNA polymerase-3 subunit delta'
VGWALLRGHDEVVQGFRAVAKAERLPHALLFCGPEGVGKRLCARLLAQALLCGRREEGGLDPCGICQDCAMVKAGAHPDLLELGKPEDRTELPIAVIRQLCLDLGLKPARGSRRIAIVDDADDLSEEAANAFLKTLEEPPPGSVLILVGTSPELQIDTIRSRCRVVNFAPLSEHDLIAVLTEQGIAADAGEAARLAKEGEGSVSRAKGLADQALARFRRDMIDEVARTDGFDAPGLARKLKGFVEEAGKEAGPRRRRAALLIGELARFFRGVLWQTAGLEPPAPDPDDRKAARALAERLEPEDVFVLADRCMVADYQVQRMANIPLLLDALLADLGPRDQSPPGLIQPRRRRSRTAAVLGASSTIAFRRR